MSRWSWWWGLGTVLLLLAAAPAEAQVSAVANRNLERLTLGSGGGLQLRLCDNDSTPDCALVDDAGNLLVSLGTRLDAANDTILTYGAATTAAPTYTNATSNPLSLQLDGDLRVGIEDGVDVLSIAAGANLVGRVQLDAHTANGADLLALISAGVTEDETAVKATSGTLYAVTATNTNAAVRYLKCENDTAAGTAPGTDTPEFRMAIPGATTGAGFTASFGDVGWTFSTALTCWLVTGAADSDVAEVAANEIMVNFLFK